MTRFFRGFEPSLRDLFARVGLDQALPDLEVERPRTAWIDDELAELLIERQLDRLVEEECSCRRCAS